MSIDEKALEIAWEKIPNYDCEMSHLRLAIQAYESAKASEHVKETPESLQVRETCKSTEQPVGKSTQIMHNGPFGDTYPMPEHGWTCFHCGETFTKIGAARDHFGATPISTPGCCMRPLKQDEKAVLIDLRRTSELLSEAQKELATLRKPEPSQPVDCREAFEKWCIAFGIPIIMDEDRRFYWETETDTLWQAWQAAWNARDKCKN